MAEKQNNPGLTLGFADDVVDCWNQLPNKGLFFTLLAAWGLLFQFLGNATFGYVNTASLFAWMYNAYTATNSQGEDGHGLFVPLVVLALFWWKRKTLLALPARTWWPGLFLLALALGLHTMAYLIQQPLLSIVALFAGIYSLMGLVWGPAWLRAGFFPFFLFAFCIPISSIGQPITFPLRIIVTKLVVFISNNFLGINVVREGTRLFNASQTYGYDVAAACSGLQSFVAILGLCVVFAFVSFDKSWKRLIIIASALPLAIVGNTIRLMCIVIAAEMQGQAAGEFVHGNFFFEIVPYVPAIGGVLLLGHWLRERDARAGMALEPKPV
jgi:exosortase